MFHGGRNTTAIVTCNNDKKRRRSVWRLRNIQGRLMRAEIFGFFTPNLCKNTKVLIVISRNRLDFITFFSVNVAEFAAW